MLKRVIGYFLLVLGILAIYFFMSYSGKIIPYPFLFYLLSFAILIIAVLILRNAPTKAQLNLRKQIADLKENGDKIVVDFSRCEIKENNYREEQDNLGEVQIVQSVIIYNYQNNRTGNTEKFVSRIINLEKAALLFYLQKQVNTVLYVNKNDRSKYYFDLDFLKN
jgi:hypothetical protein